MSVLSSRSLVIPQPLGRMDLTQPENTGLKKGTEVIKRLHDDDTSARDLYRVDAVPRSILVAPYGTIAVKNLRGERLVKGFENAMLVW